MGASSRRAADPVSSVPTTASAVSSSLKWGGSSGVVFPRVTLPTKAAVPEYIWEMFAVFSGRATACRLAHEMSDSKEILPRYLPEPPKLT